MDKQNTYIPGVTVYLKETATMTATQHHGLLLELDDEVSDNL